VLTYARTTHIIHPPAVRGVWPVPRRLTAPLPGTGLGIWRDGRTILASSQPGAQKVRNLVTQLAGARAPLTRRGDVVIIAARRPFAS